MKFDPWMQGLHPLHDLGKILFSKAYVDFSGLFLFCSIQDLPVFKGTGGAYVAFIWYMYVYAYFPTSVSVDLPFVKS